MRAKFAIAAVTALTMLIVQIGTTEARPRPARNSKAFEANKGFGLGFMVGVPAGLSGKYYLSEDTALDFGLGLYGLSNRNNYDNAIHFYIDHLWHPVVLTAPEAFWMPLYFGVGARILDHRSNRDFADDLHLGVRAPLGIMIDFNKVPLDIFLELALVIDVLQDDHGYADLNLALGMRYYFN